MRYKKWMMTIFISNAMIAGGNQAKSCGISDKASTFESKF
jgi:hypothetical protein